MRGGTNATNAKEPVGEEKGNRHGHERSEDDPESRGEALDGTRICTHARATPELVSP